MAPSMNDNILVRSDPQRPVAVQSKTTAFHGLPFRIFEQELLTWSDTHSAKSYYGRN